MKCRSQSGLRAAPSSCAYSRDGILIASGCTDGSIQMWDHDDVPKGHVVRTLWHPKLNQIVGGCGDGSVRLYYDQIRSHNGARLVMTKPKKRVRPVNVACTNFQETRQYAVLVYLAQLMGIASRIKDEGNPREAILRHAKKAAKILTGSRRLIRKRSPSPSSGTGEDGDEDGGEPDATKSNPAGIELYNFLFVSFLKISHVDKFFLLLPYVVVFCFCQITMVLHLYIYFLFLVSKVVKSFVQMTDRSHFACGVIWCSTTGHGTRFNVSSFLVVLLFT